MRCQQLQRLLTSENTTDTYDEQTERLVAHLRTCPRCQHGIIRLSRALIAHDTLSCDQCRQRLPSYYEATHPDYPLVKMSEQELREILIHLSHCTSCQDDYRFLATVAEMEEAENEARESEGEERYSDKE